MIQQTHNSFRLLDITTYENLFVLNRHIGRYFVAGIYT